MQNVYVPAGVHSDGTQIHAANIVMLRHEGSDVFGIDGDVPHCEVSELRHMKVCTEPCAFWQPRGVRRQYVESAYLGKSVQRLRDERVVESDGSGNRNGHEHERDPFQIRIESRMFRNLYDLNDFGINSMNHPVSEVRLRKDTFGFGSELRIRHAEVEYRNTLVQVQMNLVISGLQMFGNFLDDLGRKICQRGRHVTARREGGRLGDSVAFGSQAFVTLR